VTNITVVLHRSHLIGTSKEVVWLFLRLKMLIDWGKI